MLGERYGRLVVVSNTAPYVSPKGLVLPKVNCLCDCGVFKSILVNSLKTGHTQSCGCYLVESRFETRNATHGKSGTPEYKIWKSMKARCSNPKAKHYDSYGGRGITVCDRWLDSFENFLEDMGERPTSEHSIERLDVNGGYDLGNCKWLEFSFQARNKRKRIDNTSGKTGVFYHKKSKSWDVIWMDGVKRKTKCFSISKFGDKAYSLACEHRDSIILDLNKMGACYADTHGQ